MRVTKKILIWAGTIFFNQFSGNILFSSAVYFAFLHSCFLFVLVSLFFEIQNIYSDTHWTTCASE